MPGLWHLHSWLPLQVLQTASVLLVEEGSFNPFPLTCGSVLLSSSIWVQGKLSELVASTFPPHRL